MEASLYVNDIDSIVLDFLVDHAFLLPVEQVQQLPIPWPFHDALFHDVSTHGRATPGGYGASFPYQGILDPPPLDDPIDSLQENISLPLAGDILPETATLHAILASRRSVRVFTQKPLAILEVGALFDLALRARRTIATPDEHLYSQAYPSGGARSEISTYLIVARGHGLASGVYAYCKLSHALCILQQHDGLATAVLDCLSKPTGVKHSSAAAAVLFVADYQRMAWKYEGMAYAAILRNVGCIYQTVSLSATSLGLGSCALGGGWGQLEETILASFLGEKVIVGAMLIGWPDAD
jgi:SagB-type dehydrogenase family enzyme